MLTTPPEKTGSKPTQDFPRVYGILMDWPIDEDTARSSPLLRERRASTPVDVRNHWRGRTRIHTNRGDEIRAHGPTVSSTLQQQRRPFRTRRATG